MKTILKTDIMNSSNMIKILIIGLTTVLALSVLNKNDFKKEVIHYYKLKS